MASKDPRLFVVMTSNGCRRTFVDGDICEGKVCKLGVRLVISPRRTWFIHEWRFSCDEYRSIYVQDDPMDYSPFP